MIMARFLYKEGIYGEWTPALPNTPLMVPNEKYAGQVLGVEFVEYQGDPVARLQKHVRKGTFKFKTVRNGEV